ncbi:Coiled-coil domain-containing protein [Trichinella papuae]|uniref:Coiled-coil domain-containing protein n=1 Tax=Trichinella papuae TaxID=268474 RepID=A0A0V1M5N7_9BILA|nr:Coiled-coil domain-containing protein [Trichinella papuae]
MPYKFIYFLLLQIICGLVKTENNMKLESSDSRWQNYLESFLLKRHEQRDLIKQLIGNFSQKGKGKAINMFMETIIMILEKSRVTIESSGYTPGMTFPADAVLRDAVSRLLENTAFISELTIYFPHIVKRFLNDTNAKATLLWSIAFCNSTGFYDLKTTELMYLVGQELGLIPANPDYVNPYQRKNLYFEEPRWTIDDTEKQKNDEL